MYLDLWDIESRKKSITFFNNEVLLTFSNGLGILSVNGNILFPKPAASIIAEKGFNTAGPGIYPGR